MKTVSPGLATHLAGNPTTLASCWKVKRWSDGVLIGFTSHDQDLDFDLGDGDGSITYLAATGFSNSAASNKSDLSVDNMEITAFLNSDAITEADLRANVYDYADVKQFSVNWSDLTQGALIIRRGTLGIVKIVNGAYTAELRGLSDKLRNTLGASFGPICRAEFGSGLNGIDLKSKYLCMVDVTAYQQTATILAQGDPRVIVPNAVLAMPGTATPTDAAPGNWFADGIIKFLTGTLAGLSFEIKTSASGFQGEIHLFLPTPRPAGGGDEILIEPGCNKSPGDCTFKFQNIVNFRGEPFIPGMDKFLDVPGAGSGLG